MSYVDSIFYSNLEEIFNEEWEVDNRAKWKDGSPIETKRVLQVVNKYDLSKGFPILALRDINWKAAIDEQVIWIYSKMSNNVEDLNSKIWNSWANEEGEIKQAYGHQIAKPTMGFNSQIEYVLHEIKNNPTSRRIQMNMFSAEDQQIKAKESLIECAYATHFSVKHGKLYMTLIQRSNDFITANNWNVTGYAALQHVIAMECDLDVGIFTHVIQDQHMYNKHLNQACELARRFEQLEDLPLPTLKINKKPFFELTVDDFELVGYENHGSIEKIDVAI